MRLLSHPDLKAKGVPYTPYHLRRLEQAGRFPARVSLGGRVAWVEAEIDAWIREKMKQRETGAGA
jgi:prophage regulatory protein